MPYVERDEKGAIIATYANLQEGVAEEFLEDDDPEVMTFLNPPPPPAPPYTLQVSLIWMRMSEQEAESFDEAMAVATPFRLRKAFNSAQTMMSDGELFTFTEIILASSIGAARASAVLAAPEMDMAASLDVVAF